MAGDTQPSKGLDRVATVAASALGLVGYLYALGGIVVWLQVQTAQLPPDGAIVAANDKHLLAIGVRVVAFELFLLLVIGVIVAVLVGVGSLLRQELPGEDPDKKEDKDKPPDRRSRLKETLESRRTLGGFIAPGAALLLVTIGLSLQGSTLTRVCLWIPGLVIGTAAGLAMIFHALPPEGENHVNPVRSWLARKSRLPIGKPIRWRGWLESIGNFLHLEGLQTLAVIVVALSITLGIVVLPLLQGTILLGGTVLIFLGPLLNWPDRDEGKSFGSEMLRSGGLLTAVAVATLVALAWVATPPIAFTRAIVEPLHHSNSHYGAYLDRGDGGVYLGTCTVAKLEDGHEASTEARITLVPDEESTHIRLGPETYRFDPGGRPSIWQTVEAVVGGSSEAGIHNAPLHHPLRGQATHACGTYEEPRSGGTTAGWP